MFRQSVLLLVLVSLISFSACEPLRPKRTSEVAAVDDLPTPDPRCVGSSTEESWKEDCNTCFCGPQGIVGCTRKLCPKVSHTGEDARCLGLAKNETVSWKDDCNTCFCAAAGIPACTRKLCLPNLPAEYGVDMRPPTLGTVYSSIPNIDTSKMLKSSPHVDGADAVGVRSEAPATGVRSEGPAGGIRYEGPAGGIRYEGPAGGIRYEGPTGGIRYEGPTGGIRYEAPAGGIRYDASASGVGSEAPAAGVRSEGPGGGIRYEGPAGGIRYAAPGGGIRYTGLPEDLAEKATGEDVRCLNSSLKTSWKDDCNTCFCVGEGIPACTLMACFPKSDHNLDSLPAVTEPSTQRVKRETKTPTCTAEQVKQNIKWIEACRNCHCVEEGSPVCERKKMPNCNLAGGSKVKRDTKKLVEAFSGDEEQADQPRLMSSASDVHPSGGWTATAALSVITAVLARI